MHIWATRNLADQIATASVPARDKITYFVLGQVLYVALWYAAAYGTSRASWLDVYEAIVVLVITFAGAGRVVAAYERPVDAAFFETTYLLSVPLTVKTTAALWIAIYGGHWLFGSLLPHVSADNADSARAIAYWLGRAWQVFPFLVATVVAVVFWFRLAHHVRYVASKRDA